MKVMIAEVLLIATLTSAICNNNKYIIEVMFYCILPKTVFLPSGLLTMNRMKSLLFRKMKPEMRRRKTIWAKSERCICG